MIGIHLAASAAVLGVFDARLLLIDLGVAAIALGPAVWYIGALTEERQRHAAQGLLLDVLAQPRNIEDTASDALLTLVEHGIADAGIIALAEESGEAAHVLAALGFPAGWERTAPSLALPRHDDAVVSRERDLDGWLAGLDCGPRPWVARVPLTSGGDTIGLLLLASRRAGVMRDRQLLRVVGRQLSAALDHAALYEAAYRRERDLEEQDLRRREFMAAISHEIRTPLTSIQAFADLLRADAVSLDESADQLLTSLTQGVDRLNRLVGDLIDLGRSGGQHEVHPAMGDVRAALWSAESVLRPAFLLREQGVSIEVPEHPLPANLDHRHLEQVVLSLLSNANRHAPAGGRVVVRAARADDGRIRIEVEDSGPGIDAANRGRIFEPYYRVTPADGSTVPGSGLGLAIARRLVDLQGGRIWVEDGEVGGARFCVEVREAVARP
ncbi:MAG: ATP-binding protein [Dehalococcoidia bacterium]